MKYIPEINVNYIKNKYYDTSKPHDIMYRWRFNEKAFDKKTGIEPETMGDAVLENDKKYEKLPRSIRKARAVEFVLDNTRIDCSEKDLFPAICSLDRAVNKLILTWKREVFNEIIPDVGALMNRVNNDGSVTVWPDYDHSVPGWERIFRLGLKGLMAEAEKAKENLIKTKELSEEELAFYESIQIEYSAIIRIIHRMAEQAINKNPKMSKALLNIAEKAPQTFYECLMLSYVFFIIIEHIECMQARSLSNFDRVFYPYYKRDIENGIDRETLNEELSYYLMQFAAIDNYWGQPVFLGGTYENGETIINELSYTFLNVYDEMNIFNPKIQIKLSENTPVEFTKKALDMIRRGNNSIVFVTEETIVKSLINLGISEQEAKNCNITGCYEFSAQDSIPIAMVYLNLMKPFEYTLSGGYDGVSGKEVGIKTPTEFKSFDEFYQTYLKQLAGIIENVYKVVDGMLPYMAYMNPQPMLSATYKTAVERGLDALNGGAAHTGTGIGFGYIANIADSLTAVKELVFDKKEYTIKELKDILDNNFEGHEKLRNRMLNQMEHYGNNSEVPDGFAKSIVEFIGKYIGDRRNMRGDKWDFGFHVARMSYIQGKVTAASPDGRLKGEELSKNISASMGRSKSGATAAILSATKLDASKIFGDACLDLGIHPTAVKGDDGLDAMYSLLRTFTKRGGHALHINVFDAETLRKAQKEPEKYEDLQIRVCGWNVLFNNICKEEQDGFIRQAEGLE